MWQNKDLSDGRYVAEQYDHVLFFKVTVHATTDIIVNVGTTANMVCPATASVEWKFRAVGMRLPGFVYINNEITKTYKAGGRHDVKSGTGSSELIITNVMTSDAGTYTCTEEVGSSRVNTFFELTILRESPDIFIFPCNKRHAHATRHTCPVHYMKIRISIQPVSELNFVTWYSFRNIVKNVWEHCSNIASSSPACFTL